MIADMRSKKKLKPILTELFIRGRNLNDLLKNYMNFVKVYHFY